MPGMNPLPPMHGLRHVALYVSDVERSVAFYRDVFGMHEEWRPDPDNAYLTGGSDNLGVVNTMSYEGLKSGRCTNNGSRIHCQKIY